MRRAGSVRSPRIHDRNRRVIEGLGIDLMRYGSLVYGQHKREYPRTQEVGEVAHFLDFDGMLVPSARRDCANVVLFCEKIPPDGITVVEDHGPIDWNAWQAPGARKFPNVS